MLRGNSPAKIDDRGRLKIPNGFRSFIEDEHGRELFVTSLHGDSVRIYPMPVWTDIEKKLAQIPSTHPSRLKFLDRVNFYGQVSEIDSQGRVVIPPRLRESATMVGEVDVFGQYQLSRSLEPRAVHRQAAARAVHRRRRAGAVGPGSLRRTTHALHEPVMTREVLAFLQPERGGVFVDCTVGLGGHALAMLEAGATRVIGLDRDPAALAIAAETLSAYRDRVELVHSDYRAIASVLDARGIERIDGALADMGMSSYQLDAEGRGFSFQREDPLDMRMDTTTGPTAADLLRDAAEIGDRRRDLPVRRGAVLAAHRAVDRAGARVGADRDDRAAGGDCETERCPGAGSRGSIRRRARFRRFASG